MNTCPLDFDLICDVCGDPAISENPYTTLEGVVKVIPLCSKAECWSEHLRRTQQRCYENETDQNPNKGGE